MRRIVLGSGALLTGAGVLLIATLPVSLYWRCIGAGLWVLIGLREIRAIASGYKRYRRIRIDATGATELQLVSGDWLGVEVQAGSVVLSHLAWLRFRFPDDSSCAELLRGNTAENQQWRGFQMVWRHLGGAR